MTRQVEAEGSQLLRKDPGQIESGTNEDSRLYQDRIAGIEEWVEQGVVVFNYMEMRGTVIAVLSESDSFFFKLITIQCRIGNCIISRSNESTLFNKLCKFFWFNHLA